MDMTNGDHTTLQNKPCLFVVLIPLFNQWKRIDFVKKKKWKYILDFLRDPSEKACKQYYSLLPVKVNSLHTIKL